MGFKFGQCRKCGSTKLEYSHQTKWQTLIVCGECKHTEVVGSGVPSDEMGKQITPKKERKK